LRFSLDRLNITIRFPETAVPAQETSYMCIVFDLPSDTDYHLMAYVPVIDNEHVMHHISTPEWRMEIMYSGMETMHSGMEIRYSEMETRYYGGSTSLCPQMRICIAL
jgi:hypothetical protein